MRRALAPSLVALLVGCAGAHEPSDAGVRATPDAAARVDANRPLEACTDAPPTPVSVTFSPPLAPVTDARVSFWDSTVERTAEGVRLHLLVQPDEPDMQRVDMSVAGLDTLLADLDVSCTILVGSLSWDGSTVQLEVENISACGGALGRVEMIVGTLRPGTHGRYTIERGDVACGGACSRHYETVVTRAADPWRGAEPTSVAARRDAPAVEPPLRVATASDLADPCAACSCAAAEQPARGGVLYVH